LAKHTHTHICYTHVARQALCIQQGRCVNIHATTIEQAGSGASSLSVLENIFRNIYYFSKSR